MTMMYIVGRLVRLNGLVAHADLLPACVLHNGPYDTRNDLTIPSVSGGSEVCFL